MSLAEKRALADQMRGEISQMRAQRETALQDASNVNAESQLDAELERLAAEHQQASLDLEVAKNGGSVEDALAAMAAIEAIENNQLLDLPEETSETAPANEEAPATLITDEVPAETAADSEVPIVSLDSPAQEGGK